MYLSGCLGWPFAGTNGLSTVSWTCGGPPKRLVKNLICDALGVPSLTVNATTLP
jgi:hypothetical protein